MLSREAFYSFEGCVVVVVVVVVVAAVVV